ncbi:MAG: hypothetical protein V4510_05905 [bacterium]
MAASPATPEQVRPWIERGIITKAQGEAILVHDGAKPQRLEWSPTNGNDVVVALLIIPLSQMLLVTISMQKFWAGKSLAILAAVQVCAAALALVAGLVLRFRLEHRAELFVILAAGFVVGGPIWSSEPPVWQALLPVLLLPLTLLVRLRPETRFALAALACLTAFALLGRISAGLGDTNVAAAGAFGFLVATWFVLPPGVWRTAIAASTATVAACVLAVALGVAIIGPSAQRILLVGILACVLALLVAMTRHPKLQLASLPFAGFDPDAVPQV